MVGFIRLYTPRYLQISETQTLLSKISGLASLAAALSIECGKEGYKILAILEEGRGMTADFLYDLRVDVDASRFSRFRFETRKRLLSDINQLENLPSDCNQSSEIHAGEDSSALGKLFEKMAASRRLETFVDDFNKGDYRYRLGPRQADFSVFTTNGPIVVINVSYRCDAFLSQAHGRGTSLTQALQGGYRTKAQQQRLGQLHGPRMALKHHCRTDP